MAIRLFQLCLRDALMLAGAGHPAFLFNFNDPSTVYMDMRTHTNLEFGYLLAHYQCAWCTGPLCVSKSCLRVLLWLLMNLLLFINFKLYFVLVYSITWKLSARLRAGSNLSRMF